MDWRLNGFLSQLMLAGRLTGSYGEQMLYPLPAATGALNGRPPRLTFQKVLYVGLGDRSKYGSTRFKEISARVLETLVKIDVGSFAMSLPGREVLKLAPRQMMELWLAEFHRLYVLTRFHELQTDVTFVEPSEIQAEIKDQLSQFQRQWGPPRTRS